MEILSCVINCKLTIKSLKKIHPRDQRYMGNSVGHSIRGFFS